MQSPGNGAYNEHVAYIERRLGRFKDAVKNLETAFTFDPKNPSLAYEIGHTYELIYNYEKSERYLEKAVLLAPDVAYNHINLANVSLWKGDFDKAMQIVNNGLKLLESEKLHLEKSYLFKLDRDYESSLESLESISMKIDIGQTTYKPIETRLGQIYHLIGNQKLANQYFTKSRSILEIALKNMPNDARVYAEYGLVLAYLGQQEEAIKSGKMATSLIPVEKDAIIGPTHFISLTKILCILDKSEEAIENLEYLRSIPGGIHMKLLDRDPV